MINIEQIRNDTRGCHDKLFLDSAGASLMPKPVVAKMKSYLEKEELIGGYETARLMANDIDGFYLETGKLLNCKPKNIAFQYNATDAFAKALSSIPFTKGDFILTTNDDYVSNQIAFLSLQKRVGLKIVRSSNLDNGDIDLQDFEKLMIEHKPRLVAITHIPTNSGLIQQAEEIGGLCEKFDIMYLLDACQSIGQIPVDVQKLKCDFLSATGRKFLRGPRGTGFLYISDKIIDQRLSPLFIDMRGADWTGFNEYEIKMDAQRFETWEMSYASVVGLKEAVAYANNIGLENIADYNKDLASGLRKGLAEIDKVEVLDKGTALSSIVTFHIKRLKISTIENILEANKLYYSVSSKSAALIDFTKKGVDGAIRFSPHYFNTPEEIQSAIEIVRKTK